MNSLVRHLRLTTQAKTGFTPQILVWLLVAVIGAVATLAFLTIAAFFWLASLYGPVIAALIVAGFYFLVAVVSVISALAIRRRTAERAQLALAVRSSTWLDPKLMAMGLQMGRAVGWRRLLTVAAAGALVAGLAKEFGHRGEAEDQAPAE